MPGALKGHGPLVRARRESGAGRAQSCKFHGSSILQMLHQPWCDRQSPGKGRERGCWGRKWVRNGARSGTGISSSAEEIPEGTNQTCRAPGANPAPLPTPPWTTHLKPFLSFPLFFPPISVFFLVYIYHPVLQITDSPFPPPLQEFKSPNSELEPP